MLDDSIDAWFMCITSLLIVGSVPRILLYKEHVNYGKTSYLEVVFFTFVLFIITV